MNARRVKKLLAKVSYEVGPTGYGPIQGIGKPPAKMSRGERRIVEEAKLVEMERDRRRNAWAQAVKEVTGEDISDE